MDNFTNKIPCSVEILTRNSEATLGRCLESVKDFEDIIILDGNSTDRTLEIAREYGARIFKQYETEEPLVKISNFSEVRNKGLKLAKHDWFMFIDSDEYISKEVAEEIERIVNDPKPHAHAFWQPRKYILGGKVIECATTYPNQQIRFFHRRHVDGFIKPIHERIKPKSGVNIGWLKGFEYVPVEPLGALDSRWKRYIEKEAAMYENAPPKKILRIAARQCGLFILYWLRYARNLLFCRGTRMPFRYEWARHKYLPVLAFKLIRKLL